MVNVHLSDLFFNLELREAKEYDGKRQFKSWNHAELLKLAEFLVEAVEGCTGVDAYATPEEIVEDFYKRV